jgi:hypothetical protein
MSRAFPVAVLYLFSATSLIKTNLSTEAHDLEKMGEGRGIREEKILYTKIIPVY